MYMVADIEKMTAILAASVLAANKETLNARMRQSTHSF